MICLNAQSLQGIWQCPGCAYKYFVNIVKSCSRLLTCSGSLKTSCSVSQCCCLSALLQRFPSRYRLVELVADKLSFTYLIAYRKRQSVELVFDLQTWFVCIRDADGLQFALKALLNQSNSSKTMNRVLYSKEIGKFSIKLGAQ